MPDISMCHGDGCEIRAYGYRHTAKPDEWRQAYATFIRTEPDGSCTQFRANAGYVAEFINGDDK